MPKRDQAGPGPIPAVKVSIAEVAARAGVSIATVSRVMNGVANKASEETIARVREAVQALGYRPVNVGRALRHGQSRIVALLAANLANPAMSAIAASAEVALREAGYVMILCDTHDRPEIQDEYLLELRAHLTSAIVLLGAVGSPQLAAFLAAGENLLFVNRRNPGDGQAAFVGIDNRAAGAEVAELFAQRGIRRPAMIHGPLASSATMERVEGFRSRLAVRDAAMAAPRFATAAGIDHLRIGYEGMADLLRQGADPDGVFCASDLIAYGAHRRLREAGEPEGARFIVGFDDNPFNDWIAPWLSSVRVPYDAFGTAVVEALKAGWAGESPQSAARQHILPHRLILRSGDDPRHNPRAFRPPAAISAS